MTYGRRMVPLLKVKTATIITTIRAGTTFKNFMAKPYRRGEIASVQNCTLPKLSIPSAFGVPVRKFPVRRAAEGAQS